MSSALPVAVIRTCSLVATQPVVLLMGMIMVVAPLAADTPLKVVTGGSFVGSGVQTESTRPPKMSSVCARATEGNSSSAKMKVTLLTCHHR